LPRLNVIKTSPWTIGYFAITAFGEIQKRLGQGAPDSHLPPPGPHSLGRDAVQNSAGQASQSFDDDAHRDDFVSKHSANVFAIGLLGDMAGC
jgi:hypothetical protein